MFPLSTMVREHLTHNVYPSMAPFTGPSIEAIEAVNGDEPDAEIDAPAGRLWPNQMEYLRADRVVSLFNLFDFITVGNDDDWEVDDFDV